MNSWSSSSATMCLCAYEGCTSDRRLGDHLYCFPKADSPLLQEWIARVGNSALQTYSASTIRRMGICEKHFLPHMFKPNPLQTSRRKMLRRNALPLPFSTNILHNEEEEEIRSEREEEGERNVNEEVEEEMMEIIIVEEIEEENEEYQREVMQEQGLELSTPKEGGDEEELIVNKETRKYNAAPLLFNEEDDAMEWLQIEPTRNYEIKKCNTFIQRSVREMKLKNKCARLEKQNKILSEQLKYLKRKLARGRRCRRNVSRTIPREQAINDFLDKYGCKNEVARTLVKLQLKPENAPYTKEERELAKMIFYNSASAYNKLRKSGCHLPAESTIRRWISFFNWETGFSQEILNEIKEKLSELPIQQRLCALKWDEMSIKAWEEYSAHLDCVEGHVDLGELGRRDEKARHVFVFCVDSINAENRWKQIIAYFLTGAGGMKSDDIVSLLKMCLTCLRECGALVKAVTCDQCTANQKVYRQLGVTEGDPTFIYENMTYYATYDFPHLIKRLVAQLRTHKNIYVGAENVISFNDIIDTWNYDCTMNSSRLLPHISRIHLYPNAFQSMNVKRAFQMFGRRFAAAVEIAGRDPSGLMNSSSTWQNSADFMRRMDTLIDYCNCYHLGNDSTTKVLSANDMTVCNAIREFAEWSKKWSLRPYNAHANMYELESNMKRAPCFKGLTMTLRAFLRIFQQITIEDGMDTFQYAIGLTNQDSVEHLFSKLRQRGGFNLNPTARMVRLNLRHILWSKFIKIGEKTNTGEEEDQTNVLISEEVNTILDSGAHYDCIEERNADDGAVQCALHLYNKNLEEENSNAAENSEDASFYEKTSINYFAGYIVHHIMKKYDCTECRNRMMKTPMDFIQPSEEYCLQREYSDEDEDAPSVTKLSRATEEFVNIVTFQLKVFNEYWKTSWKSKNLLQQLTKAGIEHTRQQYPAWFTEHDHCYEHRIAGLRHLYKVKIHDTARKRNEEEKCSRTGTRKQKLKNVQNQ